jgi:hypothetical protein
MSEHAFVCEQCGQSEIAKREGARFCSAKCKAEWHRGHDPEGVCFSVRRLANGKVRVAADFAEHEAEVALRFIPKQPLIMGSL